MPAPPETYFEKIDARLPRHGEDVARLQRDGILIDGEGVVDGGHTKALLQIFSANAIGPIFFEFIQRKGDDGFGEGNFRALFELIEEDEIRRGRADVEGRGVGSVVSRTRCSALAVNRRAGTHASGEMDPGLAAHHAARHSASKTRVNARWRCAASGERSLLPRRLPLAGQFGNIRLGRIADRRGGARKRGAGAGWVTPWRVTKISRAALCG